MTGMRRILLIVSWLTAVVAVQPIPSPAAAEAAGKAPAMSVVRFSLSRLGHPDLDPLRAQHTFGNDGAKGAVR